MSSFTIAVWELLPLKPTVMTEAEWLGLNEYPIFQEEYREGLNKKIKDHFLYQEIGFETIEYWRFAMARKLNEVMPYYNELYETKLLEIDPLSTINIKSLSTGVSEQTSEGTSENVTNSDVDAVAKNVASAFPQLMLAGNADYATSGADSNSQTKTKADANETSTANNTATNDSETTTTGYQGHSIALLQAARAAILNIDMMIINELEPLFMIVWRNGDDYALNKGRIY